MDIARAGLDSSSARSMNSHPPILALKSAGGNTDDPKPVVIVKVAGGVAVANRRAAVSRVVIPGTAPQQLD